MSAPTFDHVVYVAPDLDRAVEDLERRTGVRAAYGGRHAGLGTHNALLALGEREYLEVLAPLSQSGEETAGWLSDLEEPRLFMWAVSTSDVGALADRARARGYDPGRVTPMSRALPEGGTLHWQMTLGGADVAGAVVPFAIEWRDSHPAETAPAGCTLVRLRAQHPEPARIREALAAMDVGLDVQEGDAPALVLELDSPRGAVEIR